MLVSVAFTGGPALTSGPVGLPVSGASSKRERAVGVQRGIWSQAIGRLRPRCRFSRRASAGISHNIRRRSQSVWPAVPFGTVQAPPGQYAISIILHGVNGREHEPVPLVEGWQG
jgi:hypothetical protein